MSRPVVHLVCKTHLDVGFTALAAEVVDRYVEHFIPSALAVAADLRARGGDERFVWTTGSWLVHTYLERADTAGRARMEQAIEAGDIAWHALPFTLHSELCDVALFEFGLTISAGLDARFGRRTIAAKMTDVPGHTRGIVPLLAAAGVELLHIGVNPACPVPDVPPVFRWQSPDGSEIVVAYQEGGYGGLVTVPGVADRLLVAHTDDNAGPQTVAQVEAAFASARAAAPDAQVQASTLDAFARALRPARDSLPVVTQEIGDTWIHGVGTDPVKVARFRELCRVRPLVPAASEQLLLAAEHTWGLDEKIALPDDTRYSAAGLAQVRATPEGRRFEDSWREQRAYVDRAAALLGVRPPAPDGVVDRAGLEPIAPGVALSIGRWTVTVDPRSGALTGVSGADDLGRYRYQTFDGADYARFHAGYNQAQPHDEWWALLDYTKPGIDADGALAAWWEPTGVRVWSAGTHRLLVEVTMPADATARFGCPPVVTLDWAAPDDDPDRLDLAVRWPQKPACRFPEAGWVSFRPHVDDVDRWLLHKLGQWVSPLDVVGRGGRHLHAVDTGARHEHRGRTVEILTLDAPLIAPGRPHLLEPGDEPPDLAGGMHVLLHDNVWGTNFPMWVEGPAAFRFSVRVSG